MPEANAQIAEAIGLSPREVSAKLRSLVGDKIVLTSSEWESPARYWLEWPVIRTMIYLDATAALSREPS